MKIPSLDGVEPTSRTTNAKCVVCVCVRVCVCVCVCVCCV
jgi:hypothetical protein